MPWAILGDLLPVSESKTVAEPEDCELMILDNGLKVVVLSGKEQEFNLLRR